MKPYLKDKRIENAIIEVIKEKSLLDKQVINCLLESIFETINKPIKQACNE